MADIPVLGIPEAKPVCARCGGEISIEMTDEVKAFFRANPAALVHETCPDQEAPPRRIYRATVIISRIDDDSQGVAVCTELMSVSADVEGHETFTQAWDPLGHAIVAKWNDAAKYSDLAEDDRG